VSKTDSTTYIETNPEKARCVLHGQDFKRVVNTPDSIALPAGAAPITVSCAADGYRPATAVLDTKIDGWIFGNIIFGGLIGLAMDAARGAGFKYPPKFSIVLEPEEFKSLAERDAWYDARLAETRTRWDAAIKKALDGCPSNNEDKSTCERRAAAAEKNRDEELAELEARRSSAKTAL
jgi:hypothetical protein